MAITEILFISRLLKLFLPVICYVDSQFYISGFRYILQIEYNFRCTGSKKLIVFVFKYCSKSLVIKYAYQIITRTMELNCVELDFNKRFVFNAFLESHRWSRFLNIKTKYKHFIKFRYSWIIFCMEAFSIVPNLSYVKTNELKSLKRSKTYWFVLFL